MCNLTIGYNALRGSGPNIHTGSHNLIVGDLNNYGSYGGVIFGIGSTSSTRFKPASAVHKPCSSNVVFDSMTRAPVQVERAFQFDLQHGRQRVKF